MFVYETHGVQTLGQEIPGIFASVVECCRYLCNVVVL